MLEDGEIYDSSRVRGEVFPYKIGRDRLVPGWDIGIKSMKLKERCELKVSPEYAYGDEGYSTKNIDPGTTLIFDIELLRWADDDVTEDQDGGVLKRLLVEGEEGGQPNIDGWVKVSLQGTYKGKVYV